jgi:hypothetical protein
LIVDHSASAAAFLLVVTFLGLGFCLALVIAECSLMCDDHDLRDSNDDNETVVSAPRSARYLFIYLLRTQLIGV